MDVKFIFADKKGVRQSQHDSVTQMGPEEIQALYQINAIRMIKSLSFSEWEYALVEVIRTELDLRSANNRLLVYVKEIEYITE